LDTRGIEVWICGERGAQDHGEELLRVGVFQVAFVTARNGRAEGREDYDVVGLLFENLGETTADGVRHFGGRGEGWSGRRLEV